MIDEKKLKCDQCDVLRINGVHCHERGCPNQGKVFNIEDQKWEYPDDDDDDDDDYWDDENEGEDEGEDEGEEKNVDAWIDDALTSSYESQFEIED